MNTITEIYDQWMQQKVLLVKESSIAVYRAIFRGHIEPNMGDKNPAEITMSVMQDFMFSLIKKGVCNKTAKDVSIVVKMILDFYNERNNLPAVKFRIKLPTTKNAVGDLQVYSAEEQKRILTWLLENHNPRNLGIAITLCTGMRIGEICALQWGSVDLEKKEILVNSTMQRIWNPEDTTINKHGKECKTKVVFSEPKTSSGYRRVPIASMLIPLLKNYKKLMKNEYYVVSGTAGACEPRTYRSYYKKVLKEDMKLGRCIHFHGLRHSFATRLISTGTDAKTVSKILGHSTVEMTMNLYVHPTDSNKSDAINKSMKGLFK